MGKVALDVIKHSFPFCMNAAVQPDLKQARTAALATAIEEAAQTNRRLEPKRWIKIHHVPALLYGHAVVLEKRMNSWWSARIRADQFAAASQPNGEKMMSPRRLVSRRFAEAFGSRSFYSIGIAPLADRDHYMVHGLGALDSLDAEACHRSLARTFGMASDKFEVSTSEDRLAVMSHYFANDGADDDYLGLGGMYASPLVMREARNLYEEDSRMLCELHEAKVANATMLEDAA